MKLSEIGHTLREIRVTPVKTLGQNFLHDQNLARWIVQQAELSAGDFVLEIGPGLGALTAPALATGAERSGDREGWPSGGFSSRAASPDGASRSSTAMRWISKSAELFPRGPMKLLGNLPYYVSTQILLRFLAQPTPIIMALLMLQKEVAARLSALPRSKDYGILTLVVQSQYRVDYLRTVSSSVFLPQPEVDSALVRLTATGARRVAGARSRVVR